MNKQTKKKIRKCQFTSPGAETVILTPKAWKETQLICIPTAIIPFSSPLLHNKAIYSKPKGKKIIRSILLLDQTAAIPFKTNIHSKWFFAPTE